MRSLKELRIVLFLSAFILILMIIRVTGNKGYSGDLRETAESFALRSNFITWDEQRKSNEPCTLIRLDSLTSETADHLYPIADISFDEMIKNKFLKKIIYPDSHKIIVSDSRARAIQAWIILDQLGVKNLYILDTSIIDNERFLYHFQPDTTISPEQYSDEEKGIQ